MKRPPLSSSLLFAGLGAFGVACVATLAAGCDSGSEPTQFRVTVDNVSAVHQFPVSGIFSIPVGESRPGPLLPGDAFEVELFAAPGSRLSFATMFGNSNDFFYAPEPEGIALFDDHGAPVSGDVTDQIRLWDAGTEIDQEPGAGADQAPSQAAPDTGAADPDPLVRMAEDSYGNLPAIADVIGVTLTPGAGNSFLLRIENRSTAMTLKSTAGSSGVVLSPGVWVVHTEDGPLFTVGSADRGDGLERLAEDGNPEMEASWLASESGLNSPIAPGVYAIAVGGEPLYSNGQSDRGEGLENAAEDGDPSVLVASLQMVDEVLESGAFTIPVGADDPGPALPGHGYQFTIMAEPGDRLSIATMLGQSNDLFFGFGPSGVALFDAGDRPISGDLSGSLVLWDAGTEVDQYPGAGPDQAPRQAMPGQGAAQNGTVMPVDDGYPYPDAVDFVRVTVTPI